MVTPFPKVTTFENGGLPRLVLDRSQKYWLKFPQWTKKLRNDSEINKAVKKIQDYKNQKKNDFVTGF